MYTTFLQWVNHILSVSSKQCVHALYPLFECLDKLLRAGQSLIVTNSNACRLKFYCLYSSHIRTPSLPQSNKSSSTNGLRYTSMSFPGCFGPGISTGIMMNFHFMQNHGGRLYIQRVTGQVLWPLLISPKGFMSSVLKPNLMFLASKSNSGYVLSIFLHCDPSAECLNIESFLRSSLCHRINLALCLFLNRRFKLGIIGEYHMTLAGTLFQGRSPSTSPGSSFLIL